MNYSIFQVALSNCQVNRVEDDPNDRIERRAKISRVNMFTFSEPKEELESNLEENSFG